MKQIQILQDPNLAGSKSGRIQIRQGTNPAGFKSVPVFLVGQFRFFMRIESGSGSTPSGSATPVWWISSQYLAQIPYISQKCQLQEDAFEILSKNTSFYMFHGRISVVSLDIGAHVCSEIGNLCMTFFISQLQI